MKKNKIYGVAYGVSLTVSISTAFLTIFDTRFLATHLVLGTLIMLLFMLSVVFAACLTIDAKDYKKEIPLANNSSMALESSSGESTLYEGGVAEDMFTYFEGKSYEA